ncbi:MAG: ATP-binding protein [Victivallales bacterium]
MAGKNMTIVKRMLKLPREQSFFLFGPRGTGKSTLLRQSDFLANAIWIDLLSQEEEDRFARHPDTLSEIAGAASPGTGWIVVDEIQKVPRLLDIVHREIERGHMKFALTGSSARKLKAGGANLLAGRAVICELSPFSFIETGDSFLLDDALRWGTLPGLFPLKTEEERLGFLRSYALTYLKEEIWGEQIVRKLDPFRRFLEVAAQSNGKIINMNSIARDVGIDNKTVASYFHILEDTLLGFFLEPYHCSFRKRLSLKPKFYFFDTGVSKALFRTLTLPLLPQTSLYGDAFEHFVILEARRLHAFRPRDYRFSYLMTKSGAEIDLIVERPGKPILAIEIKSSDNVSREMLSSFSLLVKDLGLKRGYCLSRDPYPRLLCGNIEVLPWREGLLRLIHD